MECFQSLCHQLTSYILLLNIVHFTSLNNVGFVDYGYDPTHVAYMMN